MIGRITFGLFFLLLVWGNMVAGMKAGLGCPDWPLCHGKVLPPFRWDIYMEFGHRVIAATATVFLVILSSQRFRRYRGLARAVPALALSLVSVEILLGGLVVILGLPMRLTTFHFMTGLTVYLLVFYMMSFDGITTIPRFPVRGAAGVFPALGALVFMQAVLGAYVRHSGAGLACPDFPTCLGSFFPVVMDRLVLAQFSHRLMAYLIFFTTVTLFAFTSLDARLAHNKRLSLALVGLVAAQVGAGAGVVYTGLYYLATALHLALALMILTALGHMWVRQAKLMEVTS